MSMMIINSKIPAHFRPPSSPEGAALGGEVGFSRQPGRIAVRRMRTAISKPNINPEPQMRSGSGT